MTGTRGPGWSASELCCRVGAEGHQLRLPRDSAASWGRWATLQRAADKGASNRRITTVAPEMPASEAARLTAARGLRWPAVTSDGRVVGVLSRSDLLTVYLRPDEEIRSDVAAALSDLLSEPSADAITVTVIDGMLALAGRLDHARDIELSVRTAAEVPGVVAIDNQLCTGLGDHCPTWAIDDPITRSCPALAPVPAR